ncbi:MAG: GAF domain-containing sensor histidine kinase [Peptococcaceae bacterium]|nr:GAF domain-containing sensor histidine kinase [Peptococcaceae bacterium]
MDTGAAAKEQYPELMLLCRISTPFKASKKIRTTLQNVLQSSVDYFDFWHASLILLSSNRPPAFWRALKDHPDNEKISNELFNSRYRTDLRKDQVQSSFFSHSQPVAATTIPVVLRAGDPIGTMEIKLLGASSDTAANLLNKAVSIGRHVADIIQESFFSRQKDRNLRKLAVWLETVSTISSTLNINQVLHVVAQLTADLFAARCCIILLNEQDRTLVPAVAVGSFDPVLKKKWKALKGQPPFPAILNLINTRQPVVMTPADIENSMPREIIDEFSYAWVVMAPITIKGKVIGVVQVDRPIQGKGFDQEEIAIISAMTRETSIAIENAKLIEELALKEQMLHQLFSKLISAQEEERKRVASEIHDGVIQSLLGIWYRLQHFTGEMNPAQGSDLREELVKLKDLLGQQIQDIRQIVFNLRPIVLDTYGLGPAVKALLRNLQEEHRIQAEFALEGAGQRLPPNFELALYRILQELLNNVVKHSQATKVQVMFISGQEQTLLVVKDNGTGFDKSRLINPDAPGNRLGLASIQERVLLLGGTCDIDSRLGWGTTVIIRVPAPKAT